MDVDDDEKVNQAKENKAIEKIEKIEINENKQIIQDEDIYPEKAEKMYHRPDKMKSMGVLQDEVAITDEIIKCKKNKGLDYDYFESKKDLIDVEMQKIQNLCEIGAMDVNTYKKVIESQLKYEDVLLEYLSRDKELSDQQKKTVTERINKRRNIINDEMNQEIVEEPEEVEEANQTEKKEGEEEKTVVNAKPEDGNGMQKAEGEQTGGKAENAKTTETAEVKPEPEKPVIVDQRMYDLCWKKLDEYKEAIEYFRKIGYSTQEADATAKAKELVFAIKKLKEGKEVDEFSLPLSVSPEYICGYTQQERLNHFSNIIKEMSKIKNDLINTKQLKIEKMKGVDKKNFNKFKDAFKKDLDATEDKINYYNNVIKTLTQAAKNPWVPAPLYKYVEEEDRKEKINESIAPQNLSLYIGKSTYDKTNAYLIVSLGNGIINI
jgi:hypothetical protein